MASNQFFIAWLVVATLLLIAVVGGTFYFVYQSGLMSGEIPLVESTTEVSPFFDTTQQEGEGGVAPQVGTIESLVYCVDPARGILVPERREIPSSPTRN